MKPAQDGVIEGASADETGFDLLQSQGVNLTLVSDQDGGGLRRRHIEFWESERTRPAYTRAGDPFPAYFREGGQHYLKTCMEHPFLPREKIRQMQFERILELVELAYRDIPVYREKYQAAGFSPAELRSWDDIQNIPVITKAELIAAFPDRCLNPFFNRDDLFSTRSSGSSGQTLLIRVNYDAILTDTIQGARQFVLQSGSKCGKEDLCAHVYTVPWWYDSIGGDYPTAFISNVIPPARVAEHLREISPRILSCYPSNLEALLPHAETFNASLRLAVTHSEHSSRSARKLWSDRLGCPVLDEYSSEEATRIAIELPCGHYHVHEDAVHLDVLDPETFALQPPGRSGIAVITNLLNGAMPFIRYVQGDLVTRPAEQAPCEVRWSQIESIDGRMNDAFTNKYGRKIPAGTMLDVTYRWMFDCDLHLSQFELVQKRHDLVEATFILGGVTSETCVKNSIAHMEDLLAMSMEHPVKVKTNVLTHFPCRAGKRRPIRCEFDANQ
jgi:phenylacetate-CoA ligase